jgi:hypothetical protein
MRHWERDLVDHLVLLLLVEGDEPLDEALRDVKETFPSLPTEEAVRAGRFSRLTARDGS